MKKKENGRHQRSEESESEMLKKQYIGNSKRKCNENEAKKIGIENGNVSLES